MIPRLVQQLVRNSLREWNKVVVVLGPRQAGKTTLLVSLREELEREGGRVEYLNCDLAEDLAVIDTTSLALLQKGVKNLDYLLVDEAQRLTDAGLTFKIIHDNIPAVKVVATGSSSFELKNSLSDAMTGRYVDFMLYPPSLSELTAFGEARIVDFIWPQVMIYGTYPEVYLQPKVGLKKILLQKITESYLFKDILAFSGIRNSQGIKDLTRALAYQIGSEVNENELAGRLKIDRKTVLSYLDILEKAFVIIRLYPFSKNPRREIGKKYKIYFADLGVRNALIGDFNDLAVRPDTGAMWENLLVLERLKNWTNKGKRIEANFWRSYSGAEVDYLEVEGGRLTAWEFKFGRGSHLSRGAGSFQREYGARVKRVDQGNFEEFLS